MKFIDNQFYHVYNRGTNSREIFKGEKDYFRFIHCLYEFNDRNPALAHHWMARKGELLNKPAEREMLVDIHSFCLMPNHFHLILQQRVDAGITKFMRKLGTGYTMYFNEKYERTGVLFQGKFKSIPVLTDEYLLHLSRYIHLNPIDLIEPGWKEFGIKDWDKAQSFLKGYRWSSFLDYVGIKNFPSVITQINFLGGYFSSPGQYKDFVFDFMAKDISEIKSLSLE